jgi:hypothetical protein
MEKRTRRFRPSASMVVAVVALIAAVGGTAVAGGVLNKKKVNNIISNRAPGLDVNSAKSAKSANKADDADKLGGLAASAYQQFCKPGTIKGTLVASQAQVTALPSNGNFQNVDGFNCAAPGNTTSSVQWRRTAATGEIRVRFVPNPESGSSIVSTQNSVHQISSVARSDDPDAPGETVFQVVEADAAGAAAGPGDGFSIVIF